MSAGWAILTLCGFCLLTGGSAGCVSQDGGDLQEDPGAGTIDEALAAHNEELLAIEGVIGTGIYGKDEDSVIFVILEETDDETLGRIPQRLDGYPVVTVDAEQIREMTGLDAP